MLNYFCNSLRFPWFVAEWEKLTSREQNTIFDDVEKLVTEYVNDEYGEPSANAYNEGVEDAIERVLSLSLGKLAHYQQHLEAGGKIKLIVSEIMRNEV